MFDIKNTPLPDYTRKEDKINSITHILGIPFCIIGAGFLLKLQYDREAPSLHIFSTILYISSMLLVFVGSAVYHWLEPGYPKRVARILDHCNIYVMISGNVTAFFLTNIYREKPTFTIVIIAVMWGLSALGMLFTFMDLKRFNKPQIFMYVALGWAAIFAMKSIYENGEAGRNFVLTVLLGGALITIGSAIYFIGKKHRYFHAVFHCFVLLGSVCIYIATYYHTLAISS